jgi:hypothetical protein
MLLLFDDGDVAAGETQFLDDFDRDDGPPGNDWYGDGAISSNALVITPVAGFGAALHDQDAVEAYAQARVTHVAGYAGCIHYLDGDNYVVAYHDGDNVVLAKKIGGAAATILSVPVAYSPGATLRLTRQSGGYYRVHYGGVEVASGTVAGALDAATAWGLYATYAGNSFDDYAWECWTSTETGTFNLTITVTAPGTLMLQSLGVNDGEYVAVDWGDAGGNLYDAGAYTRAHSYTAAGVYTLRMHNAAAGIYRLILADGKIGGTVDASNPFPVGLTYLAMQNLSGLTLETSVLIALTALSTFSYKNALISTEVDAILLALWAMNGSRIASGGWIDVSGDNAAPTGDYQAACPPATGKEAAFELKNDTCGQFAPGATWSTVTYN